MSEKYSLRLLKDIGKLSTDGVLAFDVESSSVLCCNKALGRILNKPTSEVIGGGWQQIRKSLEDDQEFLAKAFEEFMSESKVQNLELRVKPDKYVSIDAYLIAESKIIVAFIKNITKAKQHLNYITEFGARKNTILDSISHSLSGPLNMVNHLMDVLDQVARTQHYKRIEQPARLIREHTQHCIDLISSFLKEEHLASPSIPLEANRFDAMEKIKIVARRYAEFNPTKQIKINAPDKELFVTGDDVKFFQIVNNLVSNAVKYTGPKGMVLIEARKQNGSIMVSVKDNGIGIPEYLQPHLFKKNTPAARPGLRGEQSIGLGLYIIKKLVDVMDGTITVDSAEEKGSTFTVALPGVIS
jgi:two-component system sensor histidine kinase VicK